jgi:hypothetical protein
MQHPVGISGAHFCTSLMLVLSVYPSPPHSGFSMVVHDPATKPLSLTTRSMTSSAISRYLLPVTDPTVIIINSTPLRKRIGKSQSEQEVRPPWLCDGGGTSSTSRR